MTLSIIVPNIRFSRRTQLYTIPALAKNHVFAVFGESRERSLVNLNASEPNGAVVGEVSFTAEGARVSGKTNSIRFKGFKAPSAGGCTIMVAFKTGPVVGDAGLASLWGESSQGSDAFNRRIYTTTSNGEATYNSTPAANSANNNRPLLPNTEYIISMTRAVQGTPSQLRQHAADGTTSVLSTIAEYVGNALPYAADVVFDIGISSSPSQVGVFLKGAAFWSGPMSDADISAGAALLYQATRQ